MKTEKRLFRAMIPIVVLACFVGLFRLFGYEYLKEGAYIVLGIWAVDEVCRSIESLKEDSKEDK